MIGAGDDFLALDRARVPVIRDRSVGELETGDQGRRAVQVERMLARGIGIRALGITR